MSTELTSADFENISRGHHPDPGRSYSLCADAYTSRQWLDVDLDAIITKSWQWVCHPL